MDAQLRAPFKRRGHIALALLAVLVLVGIAPLATMSWKLIGINRETLTGAQREIQLMLAGSIGHELDIQVEGLRSQLLRVAQALGAAVGRRGSIPREEIRRVLGEVVDQRMSYVRYTYFEQQEVRSVSAGDHPDYLESLFTASLQQTAERVAQEHDLEVAARAILSDPILLRGSPRRSVLAIAAPVVSNGSFRGTLTALVDLDGVWSDVSQRKKTGHIVFALDDRGTVFASNDSEAVRPGEDLRHSALVQRFLTGREVETMPFMLERSGEGQRYIGSFEKTQQGWGIFVQAPASKVYRPVRDMVLEALAWTLGLFLVAALAAISFARVLSNPINRLAAASRALAAGDFSTRVEVRSRNEIGELAHTFNGMAAEIESYVRQLKELFFDTIQALAGAIDAKDPYTRGHSGRVNRYSVTLARELGLSAAEIHDIDVSSMLHDVGKIGIEDHILKKNSALTTEEFAIIKTHPEQGAKIMSPIHQMKNMIPGIKHHHERCDGSGYPDGLVRDKTPLMARIIAVADTFDAITTARPYQNPMSFDAARRRINELKGAALDQDVVEAFNRACQRGLIRLEEEEKMGELQAAG